jgi:hypothetical protein
MSAPSQVRFARDRHGYEQFYLVEPSTHDRQPRSRVLYWFRSPPNVKVGREPFDAATRRLIEAENPDIAFDWERLLDIPIPPPEEGRWRERRRSERAAQRGVGPEASAGVEPAGAEAGDSGVEPERIGRSQASNESELEPGGGAAAAMNGAAPRAGRRRRRRGAKRDRRPSSHREGALGSQNGADSPRDPVVAPPGSEGEG